MKDELITLNYIDLLKFNRKILSKITICNDKDILDYYTLLLDLGNFNISKLFRYFRYNDNLNTVINLNNDSLFENNIIEFINFLNICDEVSSLAEDYDNFLNNNSELNNINAAKLGIVIGISDNIVTMVGLYDVSFGEMIEVLTGIDIVMGMVLNIEEKKVSAIIFSSDRNIKPGQEVLMKSVLMSVPVGDKLLGRIVDPLGNPLDSLGAIISKGHRFMDSIAPSIISRKSVNTPLETGLKVIDSMVPIGHGQRELIIGDTKTGKTSIGIDAIINQRKTDTISIYVAIGQKRSSVARIAKVLEKNDCLKSSIIVAATASDSAAMQYVAPYCACAMGEYFMYKGLRILIIYDDLSKHAVAYRQLSLLLRRPPGREGYPGDVFYLHSRLLERAANLTTDGSITALPIIETIQGDVSAYIPTNVISITDGQIFLDTELFSRGIRPSVSPGLSVSRVGSAAQSKTIKKMAGNLKLELAQYREVENFAKLGLSLDDATKLLIERGSRLTKILVQNRFDPIFIYKQILILFSSLNGYVDRISVKFTNKFEEMLYAHLITTIYDFPFSKVLDKELDEDLVICYI